MRPVHGSSACVPLLVALSVSAAAQETTPLESTTVTVTGRVADPLDSHIAGAGVIVRPRDQLLTIDALKDPDVKSDAEGRFELQLEVTDDATTRPILHIAARDKAAVWVTLRPKKKDGGGYESTLDLGDIVLLDGTRIFGRVRDADGKPLAGVRVTASDMLASSQVLRTSTRHAAHSTALTGENGIFSLPSVLPQALKVDFVAPGHYHRTLQPVSRHTPLEVRLEKSGFISGRVLDERGSPVATAVTATYEVAGSQSPVQSGEDGSFRLTLAHPARYLIRATAPRDTKLSNRQTDVLAGTQENLEIVLEGQKAQAGEAGDLVVKAVDKATGEPIAEFVASVGWNEQGKNDNYLASPRLVVVASELQEDNPNVFFSPFNVNYQGPRAFVEPDGSFSLQLPPGRHELQLVDVATGIRLGASEPFRIRSGTGVETELAADVVEVRVRLQKEAEDVERIVADRLEIRVTPKQPAGGGARGVMFGGNDNYDTGVGLPLEVGQTELRVVVPPSQISFFVRSNAWRILPNERRNEARVPLGRLDYDTENNRGEDAVIPVAGPPVVEEIAGDGGAEQKAGREGR